MHCERSDSHAHADGASSPTLASRCSSSARATRSSASSSRTSRAGGSAASSRSTDERRRARRRSAMLGANLVPSGRGLRRVRRARRPLSGSRMIIGEEPRSASSGARPSALLPPARARTVPASRSTRSRSPPAAGESGLARRRGSTISSCSSRSAPPPTREELGVDPLAQDAEGFRWRTQVQIDDGTLLALARGRRRPLQGRGLGLDAGRGAGAAGLGRPGGARPRLRRAAACATSAACCSRRTPIVTLFVRTRERAGDRASTSRSGWSSSATTAASSSDDGSVDPRAARRERVQRGRALERRSRASPCGLDGARARAGARARRTRSTATPLDLCVTSEFQRTRETATRRSRGRGRPPARRARAQRPALRPATKARRSRTTAAWAAAAPPRRTRRRRGRGEPLRDRRALRPRVPAAARHGRRTTILVVAHSLPIAYALAARDGRPPRPRVRARRVRDARIAFDGAGARRARRGRSSCWLGAPDW